MPWSDTDGAYLVESVSSHARYYSCPPKVKWHRRLHNGTFTCTASQTSQTREAVMLQTRRDVWRGSKLEHGCTHWSPTSPQHWSRPADSISFLMSAPLPVAVGSLHLKKAVFVHMRMQTTQCITIYTTPIRTHSIRGHCWHVKVKGQSSLRHGGVRLSQTNHL